MEEVREELKPCPFCYGKAYLDGTCFAWFIYCEKCSARTKEYDNKSSARQAWNTRHEAKK